MRRSKRLRSEPAWAARAAALLHPLSALFDHHIVFCLLCGCEQRADLFRLRLLNFLLCRNSPVMDFVHPRPGFVENQAQLGNLRIRQTKTLLHEAEVTAPELLGARLRGVLTLAGHGGHSVQAIAENTEHGSAHEYESHVECYALAREIHR